MTIPAKPPTFRTRLGDLLAERQQTLTVAPKPVPVETLKMTESDNDLTPEQRRERGHQRHRQSQLSPYAYTLHLPVRASLYEVIKSFSYEARRTATMPYYIQTLRTLLIWAEVNCGTSDDAILDSIEDELDRVRAKQSTFENGSAE